METFDKLSLELLSNRSQYNKYLYKSDPNRFGEQDKFLLSIQKNKERILELTREFLENPSKDFNLSVNEMFTNYAKILIQYLEMNDLDIVRSSNESDAEDSDVLFGEIETTEEEKEDINERFEILENIEKKSFWGSTVKKEKQQKQQKEKQEKTKEKTNEILPSKFTMEHFMNKK